MKKSAVTRIVIWSVVAVLLIGILLGSLIFMDNDNVSIFNLGNYEVYEYDNESEYSVGNSESVSVDFNTIKVDWISGSVNLIPYDGDSVKIEETSIRDIEEKYELRWLVKANILTIKPCASMGVWNLSDEIPTKELYIYLPANLAASLNKIVIEAASAEVNITGITSTGISTATASGDTWIEKCNVTDLNIENVSGYVNCTELSAEKIDAETVSGNVEIMGSVKELDIESVSGTVYYCSNSTAPDSADVSTVSGEIKFEIPDNDGFNIEFDSVSGNVTSDFPLTISSGNQIYGNGTRNYDFETVSGNVYIEIIE